MATENALVVKYHIINHHHVSQDNLLFTIYLLFLLGGGGSCILVTYGRTTNKVTITASYSMSILLSRSMSILLLGVVRYKYCILVQCKEQCWLFDIAEVNKKASTFVCIVYENAIK